RGAWSVTGVQACALPIHPKQIFGERFMSVRVGGGHAQTTGDEMKRPFEFDSARGFEFAGMQRLTQHLLDVAAAIRKDLRHAINRPEKRRVGQESVQLGKA